MKSLVYLEHYHGELEKGGLGVLGKAASLGDAAGVVLGEGAAEVAAAAGAFGAAKVYACDAPELATPLPQARVDALATLVEQSSPDAVLFGASVLSADVASGLAARLGAGLNWDLIDLAERDGELVGTRPALGDTVIVEVGWTAGPRLGLIRSGALDPVESGGTAEVETFETSFSDFSTLATLVEQTQEESSGPSIEDADIIVAGGRGLGEQEKLQMVRDLADALGGVPGVSMPLVSEGWAPYSMQVGQTGTVVRPRLYVACGISGQMQHKIGMERSGTIVAINTDEQAPIFRFCDLAVVADLNDVLPALTTLVNERKGITVTS